MKKISLFVMLAVFINVMDAKAQSTYTSHRIGIVVDQDYFLKFINPALNHDQNYTMGAALPVFQFAGMGNGWFYKPHRFLAKTIFGKKIENFQLSDATIMLANATFTPRYLGDLEDPVSLYQRKNDRPFASLNFIGTSISYNNAENTKLFTLGINVGAIGLNVSKAVQTKIHEDHIFGTEAPIPYGWKDQIAAGSPQPTLLVTARKDWLLLGESKNRGYFQVSTNAEARAGYYTSAGFGLNTRIGILDNYNWVVNTMPMSNSSSLVPQNLFELYLLGGVKGNVWLYNALLMGQFGDDPYALSFDQMRKATIEWNVGVGTKIPITKKHAFRFSAFATGRSSEFNTVNEFERHHAWVDLQLYYEW